MDYKTKEKLNKYAVYVGIILLTVAAYSVIVGFAVTYPSTIYDINKANGWLKQARSSTDIPEMTRYMELALTEIDGRTGNPAWIWATSQTNFDVIKEVIQTNIEASLDVAETEPRSSYGYQRAIDNLEEAIIDIQTNFNTALNWLTIISLGSIIQLAVWLIASTIVIIIGVYTIS
uniref:Putative glycosyltransferase n=1 Tax=viral metagenome TaxID=1070528 RepID=A0A6M3K1C4_9ZZZZ